MPYTEGGQELFIRQAAANESVSSISTERLFNMYYYNNYCGKRCFPRSFSESVWVARVFTVHMQVSSRLLDTTGYPVKLMTRVYYKDLAHIISIPCEILQLTTQQVNSNIA